MPIVSDTSARANTRQNLADLREVVVDGPRVRGFAGRAGRAVARLSAAFVVGGRQPHRLQQRDQKAVVRDAFDYVAVFLRKVRAAVPIDVVEVAAGLEVTTGAAREQTRDAIAERIPLADQ